MIHLVHSKFHPNLRLAPCTRQNQLTIFSLRGAQGQSPLVQYVGTSNCRGNTASELGLALPQVHFALKNPTPKRSHADILPTKKHANGILKKSTPAKQQMAIADSKLQLLPHEGFSMKTHTKDPTLTNGDQPTLIPLVYYPPTRISRSSATAPFTYLLYTSSASTRKEKKGIFLLIEIPPPSATKTRRSSFAEQI